MANNIIIKDSNAQNLTLESTETAGVHVPHHISKLYDSNGVPLGTQANPLQIEGGVTDIAGNALGSSNNPIYSVPTVSIPGRPGRDSYYRTRVSNTVSIFDSVLEYDLRPDIWETIGTGACSHLINESAALLSVGAGQNMIRITKKYNQCPAGQSLIARFLVLLGRTAGVTRRVGYYDSFNGVYIEDDGTGIFFVDRKSSSGSTVNERVPQSLWNIDKLDGTSASGITLDVNKVQSVIIDMQYGGKVRVGFEIGGDPIYVHEMTHSNVESLSFLPTLNLPCTYELISTTGVGSMRQFSTTVLLEGDSNPVKEGIPGTKSTGVTPIAVNGVEMPIIAIRVAPDWPHNSTNVFRGHIKPTDVSVFSTQSQIHWHLRHNSVITGGTWIKSLNSPIEYNTTMTSYSGGSTILEDYTDKKATGSPPAYDHRTTLTLDAAGAVQDSILLTAVDLNGATDVYGKIQWEAFY